MMVTEIELKYSLQANNELVNAEQVKLKIDHLLKGHDLDFSYQSKQLSNYYFDTGSLALRQQKIALRTRGTKQKGGAAHFEQTIKTSGRVIAGLHQRPEYNVDIDNSKPILSLFPNHLWQGNTDIEQLQQQIKELFSTNFTRSTWLITLNNAQVEIAFDSGEIACQGHEHKPRIYEIELELVSGDAGALFFLSKLLFSELPLRPGQLTKAARGYALYREIQVEASQAKSEQDQNGKKIATSAKVLQKEAIEKISLAKITSPESSELTAAFYHGIDFTLTQLQLGVDSYVDAPSLSQLSRVTELLALLRQGFWLFNSLLTDDELKLRSELSYFIRTISWVDNARYIQALKGKQSSYQKETAINKELIAKLQLAQERYPNESQILALLHSERFNNLQLNLLDLLLNRENDNAREKQNSSSLAEFATEHLNRSATSLIAQITQREKPEHFSLTEKYLTSHSLLIRALLTSSWFSCLFEESSSERIKLYNMPWLDIKQGISELQSLQILNQQLALLPHPEQKLQQWQADKSDNLLTALEQSRTKALTMKPYWL